MGSAAGGDPIARRNHACTACNGPGSSMSKSLQPDPSRPIAVQFDWLYQGEGATPAIVGCRWQPSWAAQRHSPLSEGAEVVVSFHRGRSGSAADHRFSAPANACRRGRGALPDRRLPAPTTACSRIAALRRTLGAAVPAARWRQFQLIARRIGLHLPGGDGVWPERCGMIGCARARNGCCWMCRVRHWRGQHCGRRLRMRGGSGCSKIRSCMRCASRARFWSTCGTCPALAELCYSEAHTGVVCWCSARRRRRRCWRICGACSRSRLACITGRC